VQIRRRLRRFKFSTSFVTAVVIHFANFLIFPAAAADTANETRALNEQVFSLLRASNLSEAEIVAKKALLLCDDAGDVKVLCASHFNEVLADIAFGQKQNAAALAYQEQALRLREAALPSAHPLINRALQRAGSAYLALNRTAEAEVFFERVVAGFENSVPVTPELSISLNHLRNIYLNTNRIDQAASVARRELAVLPAVGNTDKQALFNAKLTLGMILSRQAQNLIDKGSYSEADPILAEAIRLFEPALPGGEKAYSVLLTQLALLYQRQGRHAEAEPFMLRALENLSRLAEPAGAELQTLLVGLSALYANLQKPAEAVAFGNRAISWFDENKQEGVTLGHVLVIVGRAQRQLGHLPDAEIALLRALDLLDRTPAKSDPHLVSVRSEIGALWLDQERFQEAEQIFRSAIEIEPQLARPATGWRSLLLAYLGIVYREQARYADAERLLLEAVELDEASGHERTQVVAQRLTLLASIFGKQNRHADAETTLERALALEQPELDRAIALNLLGVVYTTTSQLEKADKVLKEALAIRTKALSANSSLVAETIGNIAVVDGSKGRYADAEVKFRRALEIVDPAGESRSLKVVPYSALLSQNLVSQGKLDEADVLIRRCLDLYRQRLGTAHPVFGDALKTLAAIEALREQDSDAVNHYQQALTIDEQAIGPRSSAVVADLMNLVPLLKRSGKQLAAKAHIERALALAIVVSGANGPDAARPFLASAEMAYEAGRYVDARRLADRARQIQERTFGSEHYIVARNWIFTGRLDIAQGRLDDAEASMERAAKIIAATLPPDNALIVDVLQSKAEVARAQGKLADTEQLVRTAFNLSEKLFEPDHPARGNAIDWLVSALWAQGKFADAERLQRDELASTELKRGPDHASSGAAMLRLAGILGSSARQGEAISLVRRVLTIHEQVFGSESDQAARDHLALGSLHRRVGQFEDARIEINLARNIWERKDRLLAANFSLEELAQLALDQDSAAEAVVFGERILGVLEQVFGPDSPSLITALAQLGRFYTFVGRNAEAEQTLARINSLIGDNPAEQTPGYLGILHLRALVDAGQGNFVNAEAGFVRAIAVATKYGSLSGHAVGLHSFNLASIYLRMGRSKEAIDYFLQALNIFKRENGDRTPVVGYALLGAAQAYEKIGDPVSSKALLAAAIDILGPTISAERPLPNWL
jgi:tetratricopeptide (TPR) repeat protein